MKKETVKRLGILMLVAIFGFARTAGAFPRRHKNADVVLPVEPMDHPHHWYKDYRWWIGEAVIATAVALDVHSSCDAFDRLPGVHESNLLVIGKPTCQKVSLVGLGALGFQTGMHAWEYNESQWHSSKAIRYFGMGAIPGVAVGVHVSAAWHNYEVGEKP